jgi:hypothetical protein
MTKLATALTRFESHLQEECSAQRDLLVSLGGLEQVLARADAPAIAASALGFDALARQGAGRAERRGALLAELGRCFGVAGKALSLGSIAERAGARGPRLAELRAELAQLALEVDRVQRRVSILARGQEHALGEALQELVGGAHENQVRRGALIDAEA